MDGWASSPNYARDRAALRHRHARFDQREFPARRGGDGLRDRRRPLDRQRASCSQRRFLLYRQLPLGSRRARRLTEWWALYCNIHGSEPLSDQGSGSSSLSASRVGDLSDVRRTFSWRPAPSLVGAGAIRSSRSTVAHLHLSCASRTILHHDRFRRALSLGASRRAFFSIRRAARSITSASHRPFSSRSCSSLIFSSPAWPAGFRKIRTANGGRRSAAWILITICGWIAINVIVLWGAQVVATQSTDNRLGRFSRRIGAGRPRAWLKAILGDLRRCARRRRPGSSPCCARSS